MTKEVLLPFTDSIIAYKIGGKYISEQLRRRDNSVERVYYPPHGILICYFLLTRNFSLATHTLRRTEVERESREGADLHVKIWTGTLNHSGDSSLFPSGNATVL